MNRIPTFHAFERSISVMNDQRAALAKTQGQLSTGLKVNSPGDDPLASAQAERTRSQLARMQTERRMMDYARTMLSQSDSVMGQIGDTLQQVREQLVSAGNGARSPADRAMIAQQLRGMREELIALANHRDGNGGYLFGGQSGTIAPFQADGTPTPGVLAGEQSTGAERSFTTSQDGRAILVGNGGGRGIFEVIDDVVALLEDPAADDAMRTAGLASASADLDVAHDRLLLGRTRAGEQLRALESRERLLENGELDAQGRLSDLVDLDYASAISQLQGEQLALEAAMATYAKVSRLSLFDYL